MDGDSWQVLTLIDVFHVGGVPLWTFWIVIYLLLGTQSRALSLELLKFPALKVGDQRRQVGPIVSTVAQKGSALHWPPRNGRGPQILCSTHAHRHAYFTYISFMFVLFLFSYYVRAVSATNVIWVDAFFFWTQRIQKLRYMVQALESWDHWNIWIPCPARPNYQHNLLRHRHLPSGDGQARAKRLRPDSRRCWGRSDQLCDPWTKKGCTKDPLSGTVRKEQRLRTLKSRLWWKEWIESLTFAPDELKTVYIHACHILQEIYVYIYKWLYVCLFM